MRDDFFGEKVLSRSQLIRSAITFGKLVNRVTDKSAQLEKIELEIAAYNSTKGGMWNYEDLFMGLTEIARGSPVDALEKYILGLPGRGEAQAKSILLKELLKNTPIVKGKTINIGPRMVHLDEKVYFLVEYDFSIIYQDCAYCFFVYPLSKALKSSVKNALINEFSMPFEGMKRPHKLVFVENPVIDKRRRPATAICDFDFRGIDENFREHLRISGLAMNS